MKSYISLTVSLLFVLVSDRCDQRSDLDPDCNEIHLNKAFTARIGEEWCIPETGWKITFGPVIGDSRCNVPGIECIWAGSFVMAASISNGEITQDTFEAVHGWQDTLYSGPYKIYLNKVIPEVRESLDPLDPSAYSFEMLIK